MKVKVLKNFRDKHTKRNYKIGEVIEVNQRRFEEINSTAFGVLVEEIKEMPEFDSMTKKEIIEYAKGKGIEFDERLTKKEMIEGLM